MKSPFPGMDPYIEACGLWEDFYGHLIEYIAGQLADTTPRRYVVRTGERSYLVLVESEGKTTHPLLPDVIITTPRGRKRGVKRGGTAVAELVSEQSPHVLRAFIQEEHRETFVEIYEADPEMRLVTRIEVLSPSNKRPNTPGWDLYQPKRQSVLLGKANLVEIDLLRDGQRMPMFDAWPRSPYTLTMARAGKPEQCLVWEAYFQYPVPTVSVPLAKPDADINLSLQPLIDAIYQRYRYAMSIRYTEPLTPPLGPEEGAWCQKRLRTRSKHA